jgi:hypothetical protein
MAKRKADWYKRRRDTIKRIRNNAELRLSDIPTGRPTTYKPEYALKIDEYLATCSPEQMIIPTIEGFCLFIGSYPEKVKRWCRRFKMFRLAIQKLKMKQKEYLMNLGLFGGREIGQAMAIFLLKANHKMVETSKTDIDIKTKGKELRGLIQINEMNLIDTKKKEELIKDNGDNGDNVYQS